VRVCFVSFEYPPNIIGGAGTYAETIVKGLRNRGIDVFTITGGGGNDYDQKTYRVSTPKVEYWQHLLFTKAAMSLLRRLDNLLKFDVVHFNEPHITLGKLNLPTVCTLHSIKINDVKVKLSNLEVLKTARDIRDLMLKGFVGSICDVFTVYARDKIICPSSHLERLIKSFCFVDEERVCVVPNGIDLEAFDKIEDVDDAVLSKYDLHTDNYLLYMGRLAPLKGIQYLIEAFRAIKREHAHLKLVISGTGEFEKHIKDLACGTEDVVFTGHIDSMMVKKALYENCVAVAVPSFYEGLPLVVLEAMACRKAVIASDVGGIPSLVRHGKNGFLVKPRDSTSIEKFVRILLEDSDLRKNMGSFGRKLAEKEFTVDKMVSETLRVYKSLV
jgi:glycosyltransferase involved in cell wall biosynthesis